MGPTVIITTIKSDLTTQQTEAKDTKTLTSTKVSCGHRTQKRVKTQKTRQEKKRLYQQLSAGCSRPSLNTEAPKSRPTQE